ncbi:MAG: hypothetical protein [Caudoviricetes sp.]|nr:MAG: hypothetical protein [Caudoviricetes sp.]
MTTLDKTIVLGDDYFLAQGSLYRTKLKQYKDGDYGFVQEEDAEGLAVPDRPNEVEVYMNRAQAVAYAKLILRNEGINCG